ncbi:hypothetical protein [Paenibacillus monticola]|uniref:Uncharacterized protein n=1 Tax=Paenibacillus monticola TaxID=2666075 RepID=A0A7X2HA61_9BACL|nr:hypothetical protein [Paenibacillus monticola]MRN56250.1 hypothetical protein [Paenibacillus monticola]
MNRLNAQEPPPWQEGHPAAYMPKYDRTAFDYIIIVAAYLLMPIGLVLALLRLLSTHYKNFRKASNLNLIAHVFIGGFVELSVIFVGSWIAEQNDLGITILILFTFALILLLPAFFFGSWATRERFKFAQLTNLYVGLIINNGINHIGSLSEHTSQSESDVRRDLLYLKSRGVLAPQVIFSEGRQETEQLGGVSNPEHAGRTSGFEGAERLQPRGHQAQTPAQLPKSINCSGCGAQNTVQPGQSKACDYCGTTIPYS